ncbi:hypothetical protein AVEN_39008-1 [Araneus ventricosus]|uniref:Uncharacterized protein n=1 Tax=Araneus ventricosus TaxID=182803 RepID=A0A4Y2DN83_ARAVE|nr:hypothetical protein AVEN_39008-1 [Araneus ventricosus]
MDSPITRYEHYVHLLLQRHKGLIYLRNKHSLSNRCHYVVEKCKFSTSGTNTLWQDLNDEGGPHSITYFRPSSSRRVNNDIWRIIPFGKLTFSLNKNGRLFHGTTERI